MTLVEKLREAATRVHGSEYRRNMRMAADRIEKLEACMNWYADQMCEGLCQGKDPKVCANIGADNCAGCPAVVALAS